MIGGGAESLVFFRELNFSATDTRSTTATRRGRKRKEERKDRQSLSRRLEKDSPDQLLVMKYSAAALLVALSLAPCEGLGIRQGTSFWRTKSCPYAEAQQAQGGAESWCCLM